MESWWKNEHTYISVSFPPVNLTSTELMPTIAGDQPLVPQNLSKGLSRDYQDRGNRRPRDINNSTLSLRPANSMSFQNHPFGLEGHRFHSFSLELDKLLRFLVARSSGRGFLDAVRNPQCHTFFHSCEALGGCVVNLAVKLSHSSIVSLCLPAEPDFRTAEIRYLRECGYVGGRRRRGRQRLVSKGLTRQCSA